jgi:hypothetical protein
MLDPTHDGDTIMKQDSDDAGRNLGKESGARLNARLLASKLEIRDVHSLSAKVFTVSVRSLVLAERRL